MKNRIIVLIVLFVIFCLYGCSANSSNKGILEKTDTQTGEAVESNFSENNGIEKMYNIVLDINGKEFPAKLYKNRTTDEFVKYFPMLLNMSDLNNNEKYNYIDFSLMENSENTGRINKGDIMLYENNCIVLFYKSFDTLYSYTRLGYIENTEGLEDELGTGNAKITFNMKG